MARGRDDDEGDLEGECVVGFGRLEGVWLCLWRIGWLNGYWGWMIECRCKLLVLEFSSYFSPLM